MSNSTELVEEELNLKAELERYARNLDDVQKILEVGAKEFVDDLRTLEKPKSRIKSAKHTHLVDSFAYRKSKYRPGEIEVGWGVYYGPFLEEGSKKNNAQPHLKKMYQNCAKKYEEKMIAEIFK